jgi:hypothetical protein
VIEIDRSQHAGQLLFADDFAVMADAAASPVQSLPSSIPTPTLKIAADLRRTLAVQRSQRSTDAASRAAHGSRRERGTLMGEHSLAREGIGRSLYAVPLI